MTTLSDADRAVLGPNPPSWQVALTAASKTASMVRTNVSGFVTDDAFLLRSTAESLSEDAARLFRTKHDTTVQPAVTVHLGENLDGLPEATKTLVVIADWPST